MDLSPGACQRSSIQDSNEILSYIGCTILHRARINRFSWAIGESGDEIWTKFITGAKYRHHRTQILCRSDASSTVSSVLARALGASLRCFLETRARSREYPLMLPIDQLFFGRIDG